MSDITALIRRAAPIALCIGIGITVLSLRPQPAPRTVMMERGATVFRQYCVRCHGVDGGGRDGVRSIKDRPIWTGPVDSVLITLAYGAAARNDAPDASGRRLAMPPIPYADEDIAAVAMYGYATFKGRRVTVDAAAVRAAKDRHRMALRMRLR